MKKKITNKRKIKITRREALIGGASSLLLTSALAKPAISKGIRRLTMTHTWPKNFPGLGTSPERIAKKINQSHRWRNRSKGICSRRISASF